MVALAFSLKYAFSFFVFLGLWKAIYIRSRRFILHDDFREGDGKQRNTYQSSTTLRKAWHSKSALCHGRRGRDCPRCHEGQQ
ncbi:hypothetical protein K504DRAFT_50800 [Pleomassaria siparia CBS 279.74]|uniref:Uncharacterized protein n=1 Tax=Pleomassaria siparia CBS 279.74 TaxID=1314801 RepID=A0A6G1K429_9PLEO|nr:hypothetical protein K504DRAFT_50800 [Pleomassaria siparia CBS 279.74]